MSDPSKGEERPGKAPSAEGGDEATGLWPDEAIIRPHVEILADESMAVHRPEPGEEAIPTRFTHELTRSESYSISTPGNTIRTIHAGTQVALIATEGEQAWVVDGIGNRFALPMSSLRETA